MLHEQFELENAANTVQQQLPAPTCYRLHQNVANSMENERFQLQNVAKTFKMAASSSKMLQIGRKTCIKKTDPTKHPKREKKSGVGPHQRCGHSQNNSGPIF